MEFIAHSDSLCHKRVYIQAPEGADCFSKRRPKYVLHPQQPVYDFLRISAESQHLADSLIHSAVGFISVRKVLYYEYRHVAEVIPPIGPTAFT